MMETEPFTVTVTHQMIKEYTDIVGDYSAFYKNSEVAREIGYKDVPMPPTMPILFYQYVDVPWITDNAVHRGQKFSYKRQVFAGDTLTCKVRLTKSFKKGHFFFLENELTGCDDNGKKCFTAISTVIRAQ